MKIILGDLLGKGKTAEVYDIGEGRVIKLLYAGYPNSDAEYEWQNATLLNPLGLPVPRCYDLVTYSNRIGIIYDKVNGASLLEAILTTGDIESCTDTLIALHKDIVTKKVPAAVKITDLIRMSIHNAIGLDSSQKERSLELLSTLPEADTLCHGDLHYGNVIISDKGCWIIDFLNVSKGHRLFDIARSYALIAFTPVPKGTMNVAEMKSIKQKAAAYYLRGMNVSLDNLNDFLIVTAAARFAELQEDEQEERENLHRYLLQQEF